MLFLSLLSLSFFTAKAQEKKSPSSAKIYDNVDDSPEYPGGLQNFYNFLGQTLRYPDSARTHNVQGKVFIRYVVETDGALSDLTVMRGVSADLDAEAIRAMKLSPKWKPGKIGGQAVRAYYTIPVSFVLAPENFEAIESSADYPGGIDKFYNYLMANLKYPEQAKKDKVEGKVKVSFVVDQDGSLTDIEVVGPLSKETDAEAIRLVKGSRKWAPSQQNGKPVRQKFTVPITFSLASLQ
ncbi:hypothetical protein GCM10028827_18380 [Mucilaginibacter myungsuensis]